LEGPLGKTSALGLKCINHRLKKDKSDFITNDIFFQFIRPLNSKDAMEASGMDFLPGEKTRKGGEKLPLF